MWCLILNVKLRKDDEKKYNVLVQKGRFRPKNRYGSISVDVPRTFASDKTFSKRVPQAKLERVLVAFVNSSSRFRYTQGMAQWCGMFLYEMPEVLAFRCMRRFAGKICPGYMQKGNPSAHKALELLKNCMSETADGVLRTLQKHIPIENPLYTIAFSPLLSFSASLRPLDEIRYLWDFILLFGTHLNILFVLGYILTQSEDIMKAGSANEIQRMFDPRNPRNVHSRSVVNVAFKMLPNISPELYDALKKHSDVVA
jgi:cell cycle arrest protein BUB2